MFPQIEGYLMTEKLGKGSYATVFKAYKKDQSRDVVAIKCVLKSSLTNSAIENLLTEIQILKFVKHEHIVELKDFQWDSTYIYLIFEYCSGGDLSQFIRKKRQLPESIVRIFLQQLGANCLEHVELYTGGRYFFLDGAKALQVLRSHNISHMDLKPQNILLSNPHNPVLKVGDFGFAQYLYSNAEACSLRGSPLYMAPEILLKKQYDARVDLWSTGIILYECLFGQAPFQSISFSELAEKVKSSNAIELPYGAQISKECRNLLLNLLHRDPEKRLSFYEFFNHPFVDLEHMPSSISYEKGVSLVQEAVQEDERCNYCKSVKLYSEALEYLVPHVTKEYDSVKRRKLRMKLFEYINRAEELKLICKSDGQEDKESRTTYIGQMFYEKPPLLNAVNLAQDADRLVSQNNFEDALSSYQKALEIMVPLVTQEPAGQSKELLYAEVDQWMKKAEDLKRYILFQQHKSTLNSIQMCNEEGSTSSNTSSCTIQ